MQITLASPRGFCAGVDRAIDIVERALELFGAPVYVRHEVVHNKFVVDGLRDKGAIFVDELDEVPDDVTVIFSAHGVALKVQEEAKRRGLQVFDATCPLVTKVHMEVSKYSQEDKEVIFIGHHGHPEVEGTMGQYRQKTNGKGKMYLVESPADVAHLNVHDENNLAFVTQTTLSVDDTWLVIEALNQRFPNIVGPRKDDICYATQNRQDAVKEITEFCDLLLVVGSQNSSNSNRLREIATLKNIEAYLIDSAEDIEPDWLKNKTHIGVSAGASAPEVLVQGVINYLKEQGGSMSDKNITKEEKVEFVLPKALR